MNRVFVIVQQAPGADHGHVLHPGEGFFVDGDAARRRADDLTRALREQAYVAYCDHIEDYNTRLTDHQRDLDEFAEQVATEPVAGTVTALIAVTHDYGLLPVPGYDTWESEHAPYLPTFEAVLLAGTSWGLCRI